MHKNALVFYDPEQINAANRLIMLENQYHWYTVTTYETVFRILNEFIEDKAF